MTNHHDARVNGKFEFVDIADVNARVRPAKTISCAAKMCIHFAFSPRISSLSLNQRYNYNQLRCSAASCSEMSESELKWKF